MRFVVTIRGPGEAARDVELGGGALTIGTLARCDVVVDAPLPIACYVLVADHAGEALTLRTGPMFYEQREHRAGDVMPLGAGVELVARAVADAPFAPRTPAEARLLAAIAAGEPAARRIYADWLDERGDAAWAAFVRAQDAVAALSPGDVALVSPRVGDIPMRWRALVARAPIERCARAGRGCPGEWSKLARAGAAPATSDLERRCATCARRVPYCETLFDALHHVVDDAPHVRDVRARRTSELTAPFGRVCGACGCHGGSAPDVWDREACRRCGANIDDPALIVAAPRPPFRELW